MTFARKLTNDVGKIMMPMSVADTEAGWRATALVTVGAGIITASAIAGQVVLRTASGGAVSDTTDTAVNIMQALYGNTGGGPAVGESFFMFYSNQTGSIMTLAGGANVTASGTLATPVGGMKIVMFICTAVGTQTYANGVYTNVGATFNMIAL